ncbi:MAG: DUF2147 domain-containing protein [Pikeienuella sp.]
MKKSIHALAAAAILASGTAFASSQADQTEAVTGLWLTQKKGIVIDIYECGDALCGRTVWLKKMNFKDGTPRIDKNNPDPALRERHVCGIEVINQLQPEAVGQWDNGKVYDPKTGDTFDFELKRKGEKLKVRGYLGVKFLGKSETWTRFTDTGVKHCAPDRLASNN